MAGSLWIRKVVLGFCLFCFVRYLLFVYRERTVNLNLNLPIKKPLKNPVTSYYHVICRFVTLKQRKLKEKKKNSFFFGLQISIAFFYSIISCAVPVFHTTTCETVLISLLSYLKSDLRTQEAGF